VTNSIIYEPVYLGPGARVVNSVVGPHVSVEAEAEIEGSVVRESILFAHARVANAVLSGSLVGQHARVEGSPRRLNVGDHSEVAG
jgi:glucose-1-phosphate thymidylyltransferase